MYKIVTFSFPLMIAISFCAGCQKTPDEKASIQMGYDREKDIERANKIRDGGRNAFDRAASQEASRKTDK